MSGIDDDRAALERSLAQSERGLDRLESIAPELLRWVIDHHSSTWALAAPVRDRAVEIQLGTLERTIAYGRRLIALQRRMAAMEGDPTALRQLAEALGSAVPDAARELAQDVRPNALTGAQTWEGEAGDEYRQAAKHHDRAIEAIVEPVQDLGAIAGSLAEAIEVFYSSVTRSAASLHRAVLQLVAGIVTISNGAGAVAVSDRFVQRVADLGAGVDGFVREFSDGRMQDADKLRDLLSELPADWREGRKQ